MSDLTITLYKHYVRIDERRRILYGYSAAFEEVQEGDVLHHETPLRHFRLRFADGTLSDGNLALHDSFTVPLYRLDDDGFAELRTAEELEADRPEPAPPPEPPPDLSELQKAMEILTGGHDDELDDL